VILGKLGRVEEEIACYKRALDFDPHYLDAWYNIGVANFNIGRFKEALECFKRADQLGDPEAAQRIKMCQELLRKQ
jgi:tetratricopeptide (TPR) repeat protein